ncbi:DUF4352 domain-containing protein [Actinomadura scrupuli]|uniref:DUF4352 domain-containing protein n=1 Tax=Actinomadura scrupuli TaxID=559629 RepID=UPI003D990597
MTPTPGPYGPAAPYGPPPQRRGSGAGKGCLIAIGVLVGLFVVAGGCAAIIGTASKTPASPSTPTEAGGDGAGTHSPGTAATAAKKVMNGIGREYRDGKFAFTVTKVKKGVRRVGDQYFGRTAQGQYVLVYVTVRNIGKEARTFDNSNQKLADVQGRDFDSDTEATIAMGDESNAFLKDINPGNGVKGVLIFDVPKGVQLKSLKLHDSMFSGGVTIPLPG